MQIDTKISMYLNIALAVLGALAASSAQLTTLFGQGEAQAIISLCGLFVGVLGAINAGLHGYSSPAPGPGVLPKGN